MRRPIQDGQTSDNPLRSVSLMEWSRVNEFGDQARGCRGVLMLWDPTGLTEPKPLCTLPLHVRSQNLLTSSITLWTEFLVATSTSASWFARRDSQTQEIADARVGRYKPGTVQLTHIASLKVTPGSFLMTFVFPVPPPIRNFCTYALTSDCCEAGKEQ